MLTETLEKHLTLDKAALEAPNLCDRFTEGDLASIGQWVHDGYLRDKQSRHKWERRTQAAMDLALQVQKAKSFPWPNCSNVAFPLITIATLQFHSRAYPAIIQGTDVAKCRVIGEDQTGTKTARAKRISTHMSWQYLEQDEPWEEQHDRMLINLPIVGTAFKKSYYDGEKGHNVNELVLAQDLVLDYYAKSVEDCPRKTHVLAMFRNKLHSRIKRKLFRDVTKEAWYQQPPASAAADPSQAKRDNRQGVTPPQTDDLTPYQILEQHCEMDLDGDGYAEPYIITIEETTQSVLRIVTGFDREEDIEKANDGSIISIRAMQYFTKYEFLPSPDGGIYGIGFGVLLGPLNESVNTLVNQLIDAGTMATTAGGFLGRGAKIRGGVYTFAPLEWKRVDSAGDDLRKNIVPLEVREPSAVLFQLLSLLINYVQRISGTTDPMVGEPTGQNTPAETTRSMIQEGMKIYSAIFKRIWRSMKREFRKGYILNGIYMPERISFGEGQFALKSDYLGNPDAVVPSADPNVTSDAVQLAQAQGLVQVAATSPGYDPDEVQMRLLKAMKIDAPEKVYPGIKKTGVPEDVKLQIAKLKAQGDASRLEAEQYRWMAEMQEEVRMNNVEIAKIAAEIEDMKETTSGDAQDRQVAIMQSVMKMLDSRNSETLSRLDIVKKQLEIKREQVKAGADEGDVRRLAGTSSNRDASGSRSREAAVA